MKTTSIAAELPKLTRKQQEQLQLLYTYRFLSRIQLQALIKHNDYKRINVWLKYLREHQFVEWIYSTHFTEKTKPAIYYLGINGIRFLRSLDYYPEAELRKRYKDHERSADYRERCSIVADAVIALERVRTESDRYYYEVESEYIVGGFYGMFRTTEFLRPPLVFSNCHDDNDGNEPVTTKSRIFDIFDPQLPRYRMKKRLRDYIAFFDAAEWETEFGEREPRPVVLLVCPRVTDLIYAKRYTRGLLAEIWDYGADDMPCLYFTTHEAMKQEGIMGDIWEQA